MSTEHIDIYYPPDQQVPTNIVGGLDITREAGLTTVHAEFLGSPFGKDVIVAGRLLRERRDEWAISRAKGRVLFQAEAQLDSDMPGHGVADPDIIL